MGLGQKIEVLNKYGDDSDKNEFTICSIWEHEKVMFENVSASAQFRMYVNSIINDFSSVSIESLGVYRDHLNISVILYCILWGKLDIIVILGDLRRSWDISLMNI